MSTGTRRCTDRKGSMEIEFQIVADDRRLTESFLCLHVINSAPPVSPSASPPLPLAFASPPPSPSPSVLSSSATSPGLSPPV